MSWRRVVLTLLVLLSAVVSLVGVSNAAQASPQAPRISQVSQVQQVQQAPQATYGAPKEGAKVILADTSIDGPAMANAYGGTFIAWTGTDAQHHINLMTSNDGLHYSNKHILPEMSLWRPAIAFIGSQRTVPFEGTLLLAWTGNDTHHTLNLELISTPSFKVTQKITFWGETSFTAPAVDVIPGDVNSISTSPGQEPIAPTHSTSSTGQPSIRRKTKRSCGAGTASHARTSPTICPATARVGCSCHGRV